MQWSFFQISLLFQYYIISECCPFQSYNDSLIPNNANLFTEEIIVSIKPEIGNSFGFGFWMLSATPSEINRFTQNIFQVKNKSNEVYFYGRLYDFFQSYSSLILTYPGGSISNQYQFYEIQNRWIFILYIIIPAQERLIIQATGKNPQSLVFQKLFDQQTMTFQIGNYEQNVSNQFSGRLSKFSYFTNFYFDSTLFNRFEQLCQIPNPLDGLQIIHLCKGLVIFDNNKIIQTSFEEFGNRYSLSGWVKYNYDFVTYQVLYLLVRISINEFKTAQKAFGDEVFKLDCTISNSNLQSNKIKLTMDSYCIYGVSPGCKFSTVTALNRYNEFIYQDLSSKKYQEGLLQWHFFQYEYGRTNYQQELISFQLYFFNSIGFISQKIGNFTRFSFAEKKFYIFVGENDINYNFLSAQIYDLKFQFFYDSDMDFLLACHPECKNCNGPLRTNCLSCFEDQHRYYYSEFHTCECETDYYQFEEEPICMFYEDYFPQINTIDQEKPPICQLGQFFYPFLNDISKCLKCPQYQYNQLNCIDCLYNSTTWYLDPVCRYDLKQRGKSLDEVFNFTIRSSFEIDLYIINELFNLELIVGSQSFCNPEQNENCNQINRTYLGRKVSVICKNGFIFFENKCVLQQSNSALIQQSAQNCSQGYYKQGNFCYKCPNNCIECVYDEIKQTLYCKICQTSYAMQNNKCVKCGANCMYCKETYDSVSKITYLQCLKCIDDFFYYLSATLTKCIKNEISGCQYALQKKKSFFLNSNYFPSDQTSITVCTYCNPLQIYDYVKNSCQQDNQIYNEQAICLKYYLSPAGGICYLSASNFYSYSFYLSCSTYIAFCNLCLKQLDLSSYICIQCIPGFYANRLTGLCQLCPPELDNCQQCGQQQILYKDYWIFMARPFIRQFLEYYNFYEFKKNGQSQNISDYEVICLKCKAGYVFHQNKCIQYCSDGCQECILNNDIYECVKCQLSPRGRMLTIFNNQCIECHDYCALCRPRSDEEVFNINPLFNNKDFAKYTYQCLKSYDDRQYIYDSYLGQFLKCQNSQQFCENQIQLNLNLYCDISKYQNDLSNCQDENERQQFYFSNIFYEDLFSNYSFYHFENFHFYLRANAKLIKSIIIKISTIEEQFCNIASNAIISQRFGENIFSVLNVSLILDFTKPIVFNLQGSLQIQNFNQIFINNTHFKLNTMNQNNFINFTSLYPQNIKLTKIVFEASSLDSLKQQINFQNLQNLQISELNFIKINLFDSNGFINIIYSKFDKKISISQVSLSNSTFKNNIFFLFQLRYEDQVQIENCNINGIFINSSFILIQSDLLQNTEKYNGIVQMNSIFLENLQMKNTKYFFDVQALRLFQLFELSLKESQLIQSFMFNSCLKFNLEKLYFLNLKLFQGSVLIINSNFVQGDLSFNFEDATFQNIQYDEISHFIKLQKFDSKESMLNIKKIVLINNYCQQVIQILPQIERSLIYLYLNNIYIEDLLIYKGFGISEFAIFNSKNIIFNISQIYQEQQFSNLGLHKDIQCLLEHLKNKEYPETIIIFSSINVIIENFTISGMSSYNSPFLLIKSAELERVKQQENIQIKNLQANNNLLIQTDGQKQVSLFLVKSSQVLTITLEQTVFQNNILHQYEQNILKSSATLINIECELCKFHLANSNFMNNTVINGTDSIIYVNVKNLSLEKNFFTSNNIFQYELLQPYLFWEFDGQTEVFLEHIEQIFPIKSLSGNGWFIAQFFNFTQNIVTKSQGKEGGGFKLQGKNATILCVQQLKVSNIRTLFQTKEEYGGALYIDGYNSQQITIVLNNIQADEIHCQGKGGLIYILIENIYSEVYISNIMFTEVYASFGSFLYCEFFFKANHLQTLQINQIQGENTKVGLEKFISYFNQVNDEDIQGLATKKSLIFIDSGQVSIAYFKLINSYCEQFLIHNYAFKIILNEIFILQTSISYAFIQINFIENQYSYLTFSNSVFNNLTFIKPNPEKCIIQERILPEQQLFCSKIREPAPIQLNSFLKTENSSYILGCLLNLINQSPLGFIVLNQLKDRIQVNINNLQLKNISCQNCLNGMMFFDFSVAPLKPNSILLNSIQIQNSNCGKASCIYIKAITQQSRIMQSESSIFQFQLHISNYQCQFNTAQKGTCLVIDQIQASIDNSLFKFNTAIENGGAILVLGRKNFLIRKSMIEKNKALVGGGIYLAEQFAIQYFLLETIIISNKAEQFGDDFASIPQKLSIIMNNSSTPFETLSISQDTNLQIDGLRSDYIFLPSGQAIESYTQYFPSNKTQVSLNLSLNLVALQLDNTITKNLTNTYCQIKSRLYNISKRDENQQFTNNYTNLNITYFDIKTEGYNLNKLIIYYGNSYSIDQVIQLEFSCDIISIPILNKKYPYNVISSHNNYKFRLNIKTFPCQLGEIQNNTFQFCQKCDSSLGFFSLKINQYKCELKDEISTIDVKPAELKLRPGYWRPYFDTNIISQCFNLLVNCKGGWIEGDNSCLEGHVGALCEQCDIENVRGSGRYSESDNFYCSQCTNNYSNMFIIAIITMWTIISLYIAVNGNAKIQLEFTKLSPFIRHRLARNLNKTQSGALIKILTNYFQIIASVTTFRLSFPNVFIHTTNTIGTPILSTVQSQDCFLIEMFDLEIHYSKVIWLLFLEIAYILLFSFLVYLGTILKIFKQFQNVFITTLLYVYIYFQPDIVGSLISLISYREVSGYQWIQANLAYRYDTDRHYEWIAKFCLPLLLIFSLLIPVTLFLNLYQYRNQLEDRKMRLKYGYLYHEYKNSAFFWEIVKIIEKQFIIFFLMYYEDEVVLKGVFVLAISYLYSQLNIYIRPYYLNNLNQLDIYSANICVISITFSIGAYVSQQINQTKIEMIFVMLVIFINSFFAINLITNIINEYLKSFEWNFEKIHSFLKDKIPFLMRISYLRKFLESHNSKKKRLSYLISKFKYRGLVLAKGSIFAKKMISQTWRSSLDSNAQLDSNNNLQDNVSLKRKSAMISSLDNSFQIKNKDLELKLEQ